MNDLNDIVRKLQKDAEFVKTYEVTLGKQRKYEDGPCIVVKRKDRPEEDRLVYHPSTAEDVQTDFFFKITCPHEHQGKSVLSYPGNLLKGYGLALKSIRVDPMDFYPRYTIRRSHNISLGYEPNYEDDENYLSGAGTPMFTPPVEPYIQTQTMAALMSWEADISAIKTYIINTEWSIINHRAGQFHVTASNDMRATLCAKCQCALR
jgi:hypothetical protein